MCRKLMNAVFLLRLCLCRRRRLQEIGVLGSNLQAYWLEVAITSFYGEFFFIQPAREGFFVQALQWQWQAFHLCRDRSRHQYRSIFNLILPWLFMLFCIFAPLFIFLLQYPATVSDIYPRGFLPIDIYTHRCTIDPGELGPLTPPTWHRP